MELIKIDKASLFKRIDDITLLEQDWNGYNASPISKDIITNAKKVVNILIYQPEIFPTARNTIQFEYNIGNNRTAYLEIEVYANKYTVLIVYEHNYQSAFQDVITNISKLTNVINPFFDIVKTY